MVAYIFLKDQPCLDPRGCAETRLLHTHHQDVALKQGNLLLRQLLGHTPMSITTDDQTAEEISRAGYRYQEVVKVIKTGRLIEWNDGVVCGLPDRPWYTRTVFIMFGRLFPSQQPVHVLCGFSPRRPRHGTNWSLPIFAVYDPSEEAYRGRWSTDWIERSCFCEPDRSQERVESNVQRLAQDPYQERPYARSRREYKDRLVYTSETWY